MPWSTPTLLQVRTLVRDSIHGSLPGSDATIANSVLRVMSDVQGALCFLTLEYIDWLSLQLLPDTAESEWLDRHGDIWLVNADGTTGRKMATLASGSATFTGVPGTIVPMSTVLVGSGGVSYQTQAQITLDQVPTPANILALDPGTAGNLPPGAPLQISSPPANVDGTATVVLLENGTDTETDDELRMRVLHRIRQPPMGGDAEDYVQWALAYPGVTRAWCAPMEMGMGTVTVRFMMDDLRADRLGFPTPDDVDNVAAYLNTVRPVTVKDCFVEAPLLYFCDVHIANLTPDNPATHGAIEASLEAMFYEQQAPGQTIFAAWKSYAIMSAAGVVSFDLVNTADDVMPAPGLMGVLGDITYS